MIDPSIALSYHPQGQLENPLDVYGKVMSLQSLANQQKIQQQEIAANDLQAKTNAALNASVQSSTKQNDDGTVAIDHDAVQKKMAALGFGAAGAKWADAQKESALKIANLTTEQQLQAGNVQKSIAGTLSSVRSIPATDQAGRQAAWTQERQQALSTFKVDPASIPEQVPDDATLSTMESTALDAHQRIQLSIQQQQANTQAAREKDYDEYVKAQGVKADAYQDFMTRRGTEDNWRDYGTSSDGYPMTLNTKTNEIVVHRDAGKVALQPGRGSGVTGTQQDRDYQNNIAAATAAEKDENKFDGLRTSLSNAAQSGDMYIDGKGNPVSWQKLIPRGKDEDDNDYQARIDKLKPSYIADMKARADQARDAANQATGRKNDAMGRNGVTPQISTAQAIAARAGKTNGNNPAPEGTIVTNPGNGQRMKKVNGQWKAI